MAENHTTTATTTSADPKDPASFLSSIIGVPVTVKLNSGVVYKGELQSVDGYMNIALEKCAEYVDGKLRRKYGDAFVRGNNGTLLLRALGVFSLMVLVISRAWRALGGKNPHCLQIASFHWLDGLVLIADGYTCGISALYLERMRRKTSKINIGIAAKKGGGRNCSEMRLLDA
ncbi:U6 snRNA-associated Sm-like protein LSm6 [Phialophora macrospora]|uniref:U6 snRNA-associated Sm-like protein LSm6 n=1 Tax=Phialophora macrospora TaxID=1851006 RepID=A0A0D2FU72_9EURO|nr:U6 snRNA-associated Sm-like protein LSm6 [Phialophora macrospora]